MKAQWISLKLSVALVVSLFFANHGMAFDHSLFDEVLHQFVQNGRVDYAALKENPVLLQNYLRQLEEVDARDFSHWPRNEQMAFWINAYNAITIWGIIQHYPIDYGGLMERLRFPKSSIRQIKNFWDTVFIKVMGQNITLNQIEHQILRKQFGDPRIHFALVCASLGCPDLANNAYTGENLEQELESATREFINNPQKVRLDRQSNKLFLSAIFDWYKKDFVPRSPFPEAINHYPGDLQGVIQFVLRYLPVEDAEFILKNRPDIKFLDYDWSLNELK